MSLSKLHPRLQDYVKDNWKNLSPIQKEAFDPIYNGESCIIEAPTSGGKTEAVLFPLLTRISQKKSTGFKVLYVAPLKALLNDLDIRVTKYAKKCYLEAFKWHGDVSQSEKIKQMIFPSDILLTTPESIEAILLRKPNWIEVFKDLETIVLDEAHYFALTDRGSHLICLLERIEAGIKRQPQRIAVTATIGNPKDLLGWLMSSRSSGRIIRVDSAEEKEKNFLIQYFTGEGLNLQDTLYRLLTEKNKSIVFERSRSRTEETATKINNRNLENKTSIAVKVKTHHSSVSKQLREDAEISIKQKTESSINAIISTSTLELGIDIGELDQVIQVGGLNSSGAFLQRVGRTGRRSEKPQYFRGLCEDEEELLLIIGCVNLGLKRVSESILFPKRAFHILAHQIICLCLQVLGITAEQIWQILSKAHCFSQITKSELDQLIDFMIQEEFLRRDHSNEILIGKRTETDFLRLNWKRLFAIFDTGPMYDVVDGRKVIGTLDSAFAGSQELPFIFVLGGQEWNTIKLDHELQQVSVKRNETGIAPKWNAICNSDTPFELAQEVGRLLMNDENIVFLDHTAQLAFRRMRNTYQKLFWNRDKWILESSMDNATIHLWTFAGDKINRALAFLFSTKIGERPSYDFQKIIFRPDENNELSFNRIRTLIDTFKSKTSDELNQMVEQVIKEKWFSKFSACLPPNQAKKTILERDMDFSGLIRELNAVSLDY